MEHRIVSGVRDDESEIRMRRRRILISEVLVTGLIAVAYSEPVGVVRTALQKDGVSVRGLALFIVYFLTVLRFFIGDILHLEEDDVTDSRAQAKWFFDLCFIVPECVLLIFLGDLTSLQENETSNVGFFDLLTVLFMVDIVWILSMGILAQVNKKWPSHWFGRLWARENIPYGWAGLNGGLLIILSVCGFITHRHFATGWLWALIVINILAFIVDVFVLNYYLARKGAMDVAT